VTTREENMGSTAVAVSAGTGSDGARQHTAGPWKWLGEGILANEAGDEIPLAFLFDEPDARLIAAAPELLESNVTASDGINTVLDHLDIWSREQIVKHLHDLQEDLHRSRSKATGS
jgi:hypothetical protein